MNVRAIGQPLGTLLYYTDYHRHAIGNVKYTRHSLDVFSHLLKNAQWPTNLSSYVHKIVRNTPVCIRTYMLYYCEPLVPWKVG